MKLLPQSVEPNKRTSETISTTQNESSTILHLAQESSQRNNRWKNIYQRISQTFRGNVNNSHGRSNNNKKSNDNADVNNSEENSDDLFSLSYKTSESMSSSTPSTSNPDYLHDSINVNNISGRLKKYNQSALTKKAIDNDAVRKPKNKDASGKSTNYNKKKSDNTDVNTGFESTTNYSEGSRNKVKPDSDISSNVFDDSQTKKEKSDDDSDDEGGGSGGSGGGGGGGGGKNGKPSQPISDDSDGGGGKNDKPPQPMSDDSDTKKNKKQHGDSDPVRKSKQHGGSDPVRKGKQHGGPDPVRKTKQHGDPDPVRKSKNSSDSDKEKKPGDSDSDKNKEKKPGDSDSEKNKEQKPDDSESGKKQKKPHGSESDEEKNEEEDIIPAKRASVVNQMQDGSGKKDNLPQDDDKEDTTSDDEKTQFNKDLDSNNKNDQDLDDKKSRKSVSLPTSKGTSEQDNSERSKTTVEEPEKRPVILKPVRSSIASSRSPPPPQSPVKKKTRGKLSPTFVAFPHRLVADDFNFNDDGDGDGGKSGGGRSGGRSGGRPDGGPDGRSDVRSDDGRSDAGRSDAGRSDAGRSDAGRSDDAGANNYKISYFFYLYYYPADTDDGLMPFRKHIFSHNTLKCVLKEKRTDLKFDFAAAFQDRRIKSIENKCNVLIRICNLKPCKRFSYVPLRKIYIYANSYEEVIKTLGLMEDTMPECMRYARFPMKLPVKSLKWSSAENFAVRPQPNTRKFDSRNLNGAMMDRSWQKYIIPSRLIPPYTRSEFPMSIDRLYASPISQEIKSEKILEMDNVRSKCQKPTANNNTTTILQTNFDLFINENTNSNLNSSLSINHLDGDNEFNFDKQNIDNNNKLLSQTIVSIQSPLASSKSISSRAPTAAAVIINQPAEEEEVIDDFVNVSSSAGGKSSDNNNLIKKQTTPKVTWSLENNESFNYVRNVKFPESNHSESLLNNQSSIALQSLENKYDCSIVKILQPTTSPGGYYKVTIKYNNIKNLGSFCSALGYTFRRNLK